MYFLVKFWGIKILENFTNDFLSTFWVKNAFFSTLKFLNYEILIFFVCRFESVPPPSTLLTGWNEVETAELTKDSTDIYKRNMINRYMIRLHETLFEQLCYVLFIKRHQLQTKPMETDSQPEELVDELVETNHATSSYRISKITDSVYWWKIVLPSSRISFMVSCPQ